jgi:hypothetical protein
MLEFVDAACTAPNAGITFDMLEYAAQVPELPVAFGASEWEVSILGPVLTRLVAFRSPPVDVITVNTGLASS